MGGLPNIDGRIIVAACRPNNGIGLNGKLPWPHLSSDLKHFSTLTKGYAVLMGSTTYDSLPPQSKPLPGRLNIVLSSRTRAELGVGDDVMVAGGFDAAREILQMRGVNVVYVIGGEQVYEEAMKRAEWSRRVYYTEVLKEFEVDRVFKGNLETEASEFGIVGISKDYEENGVKFRIKEYLRREEGNEKKNRMGMIVKNAAVGEHAEMQYLNLVDKILRFGVRKGDRTGVGTLSVFGEQMRFNLRETFPLLTTKRVFWRGVAEELFWFIKGSTDGNLLSEKGIHIWEGNGSREFLDSRGFVDREEGDLGPVYGFQWRHFGAEYTDKNEDYRGKGQDQLMEVIETIKKNPNDRRMIISAWNPSATNKMALPPCHLLAQFYVSCGELSCQMYQRSCDMGLGVPFNIASYALLTCLMAKVTGLKPGDFIHVLGDAHVYSNHVDALKEQIERRPKPFPTLIVADKKNIEDFEFGDLTLVGYEPHKPIIMKMAV